MDCSTSLWVIHREVTENGDMSPIAKSEIYIKGLEKLEDLGQNTVPKLSVSNFDERVF